MLCSASPFASGNMGPKASKKDESLRGPRVQVSSTKDRFARPEAQPCPATAQVQPA